jgi:hypothetical protein
MERSVRLRYRRHDWKSCQQDSWHRQQAIGRLFNSTVHSTHNRATRSGETIMKTFNARVLVLGIMVALFGAKTANAQSLGGFYDDCRYDFKEHATDYQRRRIEVTVPRKNSVCAMQTVDITDARGRNLIFGGVRPSATTPAQCNGATYEFVVGRFAGGTLYWIVASATLRGQWYAANTVLGLPAGCYFTGGTDSATIPNSQYNDYRVLIRATDPNGTRLDPTFSVSVDVPLIE